VSTTEALAQRMLHAMQAINQIIRINPGSVIGTMNVNQLRMLAQIRAHPGVAQKDIAEQLDLSPASVSVTIRQMDEMDLVERRPDDDDGRMMRLYLDTQGVDLIKEAESQQIAILTDILSALPQQRQQLLIELLDEALHNMDGYQQADTNTAPSTKTDTTN